jgi:hypothetical protein
MRKRAKLLLKKQNNDEKPTLASSFKQSIQQKGKRKNKKREDPSPSHKSKTQNGAYKRSLALGPAKAKLST